MIVSINIGLDRKRLIDDEFWIDDNDIICFAFCLQSCASDRKHPKNWIPVAMFRDMRRDMAHMVPKGNGSYSSHFNRRLDIVEMQNTWNHGDDNFCNSALFFWRGLDVSHDLSTAKSKCKIPRDYRKANCMSEKHFENYNVSLSGG